MSGLVLSGGQVVVSYFLLKVIVSVRQSKDPSESSRVTLMGKKDTSVKLCASSVSLRVQLCTLFVVGKRKGQVAFSYFVSMKVLVTLSIPDVGINMLKQAGLEVEVWEQVKPMTPEALTQKSKAFQGMLCTAMDTIDATFLQDNSHLKIVSQFGAGYDNVDVNAAAKLGIIVGNTPEAMSDATADIAFMLMLTTSRKFCFMHKTIIQGDWGYFEPKAHLGQELQGKKR